MFMTMTHSLCKNGVLNGDIRPVLVLFQGGCQVNSIIERVDMLIIKKLPIILLFTLCAGVSLASGAQESRASTEDAEKDWGVYTQLTYVNQWHNSFRAPYAADNSMDSASRNNQTADITLMIGRRIGRQGELWLNPEIDQGFGLSNTLGMAGFPSGEAYKVGQNRPYPRLPRAFFRQTVNLSGENEQVEAAVNQLSSTRTANNLIFTAGHFSVTDIFDNNTYAHDPRSDFLNWSIIDAGSFDYAADAWGFTNGMTIEWNQGSWTWRGGLFQMSEVPNAKVTGLHLNHRSMVSEIEKRYELNGHPGKFKLLAFVNRAMMGSYQDAVLLGQQTSAVPDTALVRKMDTNKGIALNVEQELSADAGVFLRISRNSGQKEAYEFTDMSKSISGGVVVQGNRWGRSDDKMGIGFAHNMLSSDAKAYFAAGGMGILIGDGKMNYGAESVLEWFYSFQLNKNWKLSLDYQHAANPAYNRDRGPITFYGLRLHVEM